MKDLVKKTQFEKDVPFWILEAIVKALKQEERVEEWPEDEMIAALEVKDAVNELVDELAFKDDCRAEAIKVAARAIRFLKNKYQ